MLIRCITFQSDSPHVWSRLVWVVPNTGFLASRPIHWYTRISGLKLIVWNRKIVFLFLNQNICCGYSKEPSQWDGSFEHPKHVFKLMAKKIILILHWKSLLNWPYAFSLWGPHYRRRVESNSRNGLRIRRTNNIQQLTRMLHPQLY